MYCPASVSISLDIKIKVVVMQYQVILIIFGIKKQSIYLFVLMFVQPDNTVEDLYFLFKMVGLTGLLVCCSGLVLNSLQLVLNLILKALRSS